MKCKYCKEEALPDRIICGGDWCLHKEIEAQREAREVAKNYPELAKAVGIELPEPKSAEQNIKELGF